MKNYLQRIGILRDWLVSSERNSTEYRNHGPKEQPFPYGWDGRCSEEVDLPPQGWSRPVPRAQPWLTALQALRKVPCQSKLVKICPPGLAGNLLSRILAQTVHWEVSCWSHSITHLPRVGAGVNCRLVGAADHHALRSLLSGYSAGSGYQNQEGEPPFSYCVSPAPLTDKAQHGAGKQRKNMLRAHLCFCRTGNGV